MSYNSQNIWWPSVNISSQRGDERILLIWPTVCSLKKYCRQLLVLAAAPVASPSVHHQTSTILTSVEELSCQAFILLRDQGPSCSYLNITSVFRGCGMAGAGGISFMWALNTQNALAWPPSFGGIIWWIHVLQQLLVRSQQGSKSG